MKTILALTAFLSLAGASFSANAQDVVDSTALDALIDALENSDVAAARRLVTSVEHDVARAQKFWTPAQAIAALAGCESEALGRTQYFSRQIFVFSWDCDGREYTGAIAPNENQQTVVLFSIVPGSDATQLLGPTPVPPPPPILISPSTAGGQAGADEGRSNYARELDMISLRKGERFAQLMVEGDIDTLAAGVNEYSTIAYGFQHPELSAFFIEMNGMDSEALVAQLEHIYATFGVPVGYACEIGERETECSLQFVNPDVELTMSLNGCCTDRWLIPRIRFAYSTPEARAEFGLTED